MKRPSPEVSVIIPTFNRADLIEESLTSLMNQSFQNWECIIVDDHSEDKTVEVIEGYIEKDERFALYKRPDELNKGANSCRNFGLKKASGRFVHWFDSDDIAHPEYLRISVSYLKEFNVDFCRFSREIFVGSFHYDFSDFEKDQNPQRLDVSCLEKMLKNQLEFNTCNVVWKRSALGAERFNENIVYADEWEYYSRLLSRGLVGISISQTLFYGRKHPSSTTSEFRARNPVRRASKIKAIKLVLENLSNQGLLNSSMAHYFIQLGFFFRDYSIISLTLKLSEADAYTSFKYRMGYKFYPVIRPLLKVKGRIKKYSKGEGTNS